ILDLEESLSRLNVIHVAGTKGKGSTCAFAESILRACGYRTGLFTSPHLIDICERYRLNGMEIEQETFLKHFWWCWHQLKDDCTKDVPMPNYFRLLTLVAFKIFTAEKVDVAILEVGLGGKYDATNVVKSPVVCGIASLGFDHMEILGDTLSQIAGEKAGIFKPRVPAITVPQPEEAMEVLKDKASELSVPLQVALPLSLSSLGGFKLSLAGDHQYINAGLAVALCRAWLRSTGHSKDFDLLESVDDKAYLPEPFIKGLAKASFPGRAQVIPDPYVRCSEQHSEEDVENVDASELIFYLDGAHSPESMEACANWFSCAIKNDLQSCTQVKGMPNVTQNCYNHLSPNFEQQKYSSQNYRKNSKQILIFNCMAERDPKLLLPHLVDTCALHGVHFHGAFFVPNHLSFTQVGSSLTPAANDSPKVDISWQLFLQRTWENLINKGKESNNMELGLPQIPPPYDFLLDDSSQESYPNNKYKVFSAAMPSLPQTIKWLRECVRQNHSVHLQVLVTGSLHLIGD
ncbi:hypothetical protein KI387_004488, partial [Taxus chinensis]